MKTYLDCLPCFLSQALKVARMITDDQEVHREILARVMGELSHLSLEASPPEIAQTVYSLIKRITRNGDPYQEAKKEQNELALDLYPSFKETIARSEDPLFLSLKLAIAGNIIDLGVRKKIDDIKEEIYSTLNAPLAVNHYSQFKRALDQSGSLLYLGDNAGEIVFDKILIEEIGKVKKIKVFFVVRGSPIINDATLEDAERVGMGAVAEVVSNGFDAPATLLSRSSPEISKLFSRADMVISKGQGNYESLSDENAKIFFLLKAKCAVVARDLGVNEGDAILKSRIV
ncbi:MAG: ARMT1-like domain-containing protein [Thermodesulfobacteriota bacterium]|nr:ARMT1-like domain-containing protein [Thermodesulfobacteriota bacterium]